MGVQERSQRIFAPPPVMMDWIYPRECELCHEPCEQELCCRCAAALPRVPKPICLYCGAAVAGEQQDPYRCAACSARMRSFDFARSALITSEETNQLIYRLKYHHGNYLAPALAELLNEVWEHTPALLARHDWALAPVPAARGHLFKRGYNQAEELARALGKRRGLPVILPLQRENGLSESQTILSASDRWRNAILSYRLRKEWASGRRSLPRHIVLVDDVFTTGATIRACSRALRRASGTPVQTIGVLTLMRASRRQVG